MSVRWDGTAIKLEGTCGVAEAEDLLVLIRQHERATVDVGGAAALHTSVIQVLFAFRPVVQGTPADTFLARHVIPALAQAGGL